MPTIDFSLKLRLHLPDICGEPLKVPHTITAAAIKGNHMIHHPTRTGAMILPIGRARVLFFEGD
jgi:hypothetical protein